MMNETVVSRMGVGGTGEEGRGRGGGKRGRRKCALKGMCGDGRQVDNCRSAQGRGRRKRRADGDGGKFKVITQGSRGEAIDSKEGSRKWKEMEGGQKRDERVRGGEGVGGSQRDVSVPINSEGSDRDRLARTATIPGRVSYHLIATAANIDDKAGVVYRQSQ